MADPAGRALVVLGLGASRLHDPTTRETLTREAVRAARERGHADVDVVPCADAAALRAAVAAAAADGVGLVVTVGGDGTVRESAGALVDRGIPLAIVPAGTGNLLAATLGIPRDAAGAVATVATGAPRAIDVGEASWTTGLDGGPTRSPFVVACGTGLDARLVGSAPAAAKRRFGIGAYLAAALQQALDLRPRPTHLIVDGKPIETEAIVVLVANAGELLPGLLGPRFPLRPDDGRLHIFVVRGGVVGSVVAVLELLAAGIGPTPTGQGMRLTATSVEVDIDVDPPEPVQVDGDQVGHGRLTASIRPAAVPVIVPPTVARQAAARAAKPASG
jgi:diacylglycerol kinase family enzyme